MNFVAAYVKKPHLLLSVVLLLAVVGLVGFFKMPVNLFPDSERPQIAVVTVWPGASAGDVAGDVSRVIEKELKTIELVRRVTSTANDEVSVVTADFEYKKGLDSAATNINSLNKIRPLLPPDIRPFQVYKVSSATPAVLTLAVTPKEGSHLTWPRSGGSPEPHQGNSAALAERGERRGVRRLPERGAGGSRS